ncbi:MAG: nucleotide exchange factor GrpE [Acidobacteriia bacterium]|nr:nucleotide exchange factor GrpE [Terriglobia bacterium]
MRFGKPKPSKDEESTDQTVPTKATSNSAKSANAAGDEHLISVVIDDVKGNPDAGTDQNAQAGASTDQGSGAAPEAGQIKKLTEENADLRDRLLRKQAEFENFRKRNDRERQEFARFANFEMVRDLLPVLDGFELALQVESSEALEGFKRGMELVYKKLLEGLKKTGLSPIESLGHKFDPNFHQAVAHEERDDVEDHTVVEEFQRGYLFHGRLMRAAMVKVAVRGKEPDAGDDVSEEFNIQ